ncbi:putative DMT superfamily transporter inner membrane protein [compost metagenome]
MTGWQLLVGGLILTGVGMAGGGRLEGFNPQSGALLLYMALLSSVAFAVWSLLLKHNPVGMIAAFNFLVPVFGVALSAIFLGESLLRWSYLAALALVCGGIWLVTRPPAPARA